MIKNFEAGEIDRETLETTYNGLLWVYGYVSQKVGVITGEKQVLLHAEVPCALSRMQLSTTKDGDLPSGSYRAKVFCSPLIEIPPGSVLRILQDGKEYEFCHSGASFVYASHQELIVEKQY